MLREVLRHAQRFRAARHLVSMGIADQEQRARARRRGSARCASSAASSPCASRGPKVPKPKGRLNHTWPVAHPPEPARRDRRARHPRTARQASSAAADRGRRQLDRALGIRRGFLVPAADQPRREPLLHRAHPGRERHRFREARRDPAAQRAGVSGEQLDVAGRRARLGAEHRGDRLRIARVEFAPAARRFDDRRSGQTEPHAGQERGPLRGTGQHRRAAEDIGDADHEHRNAGRAQVEQRGERAGERPVPPHWLRAGARPPDAARTTTAAGRSARARTNSRRSVSPWFAPALPPRKRSSCAASRTAPRPASRARRRRRHRPAPRCPSARDAATAAAPRTTHRPTARCPGRRRRRCAPVARAGAARVRSVERAARAHMAICPGSGPAARSRCPGTRTAARSRSPSARGTAARPRRSCAAGCPARCR